MTLIAAVLGLLLASERPAIVVHAEGSPVRIDSATVLTPADGPPVVLYSATNVTDDDLDQFTVIAFVFDADGTLKARQTAPARHLLDARSTKYSVIVLDGIPIQPTQVIVIGVNQAQRVNSNVWWRADIEAAAVAAVRPPGP
jgi:hypothetical protein